MVGEGGFARVYKGKLADDSLVVAVKRFYGHRSYGEGEAVCDLIDYICFHRNILPVVGFCVTPDELFLVYPFMANGSLKDCLRGCSPSNPPLDWPTRMRIARGSARGLYFLHELCDPKIIHRNIKPSNILLNEEFEAVIGNFGLAIRMDYKDDHVITENISCTCGYVAPEHLSSRKASEKSDVFGYGMTLLELITGQMPRGEPVKNVLLKDWVKELLNEKKLNQIVDPNLQNNYVEEEMESLIQIAQLCTQDTPEHRPKMSEVVRMLQGNGPVEGWVQQELDLEMPLYRSFHTTD